MILMIESIIWLSILNADLMNIYINFLYIFYLYFIFIYIFIYMNFNFMFFRKMIKTTVTSVATTTVS